MDSLGLQQGLHEGNIALLLLVLDLIIRHSSAQYPQSRKDHSSEAGPLDIKLDVSFLPAAGNIDKDVKRFNSDDDLVLIYSLVLPFAQADEPTAALVPLELGKTSQHEQREDYGQRDGHFHAWRLLHYAISNHSGRNNTRLRVAKSRNLWRDANMICLLYYNRRVSKDKYLDNKKRPPWGLNPRPLS